MKESLCEFWQAITKPEIRHKTALSCNVPVKKVRQRGEQKKDCCKNALEGVINGQEHHDHIYGNHK